MTNELDLPPSVTVGPTSLEVSVFTAQGARVSVLVPKPRGVEAVSREELLERATRLARAALETAAAALAR